MRSIKLTLTSIVMVVEFLLLLAGWISLRSLLFQSERVGLWYRIFIAEDSWTLNGVLIAFAFSVLPYGIRTGRALNQKKRMLRDELLKDAPILMCTGKQKEIKMPAKFVVHAGWKILSASSFVLAVLGVAFCFVNGVYFLVSWMIIISLIFLCIVVGYFCTELEISSRGIVYRRYIYAKTMPWGEIHFLHLMPKGLGMIISHHSGKITEVDLRPLTNREGIIDKLRTVCEQIVTKR